MCNASGQWQGFRHLNFLSTHPSSRHSGSAQLMCLGWTNEVFPHLEGTSSPLVCPTLCPFHLVTASPFLREPSPHCTVCSFPFLLHRWSRDQAGPIRAFPRLFLSGTGGELSFLFSQEAREWAELPVGTAPVFPTDKDEVMCTKRQR